MDKVLHAFRSGTRLQTATSAALPHRGGILAAVLLALSACLPLAAAAQKSADANTAESQQTETAQDTDSQERKDQGRDRSEDVQRAVERIFTDPLSGVVVNRTVTVLGKDFYRYFSNYWRYNPESARYSISIHERPTARFGSEIWVLYRQQRVFHIFLPPARQATRDISEIAVEHVLENIQRRELERLTTRNPDLGPEEL